MNRSFRLSRSAGGRAWPAVLLCAALVLLLSALCPVRAEAPEPVVVRVGYYEMRFFRKAPRPERSKTAMPMNITASCPSIPDGNMNMSTAATAICISSC